MKKIISMMVSILCSTVFAMHPENVSLALEQESTNFLLSPEGEIPSWLLGTLVRNGPVTVTIDNKTNQHWFDGLAMLHAFSFNRGNVIYSNRFLRTDAYRVVFEEGTFNYVGFASDPCRSIFKRLFTWLFPFSMAPLPIHNANVNIAKIADQYVALTEIPLPVRFDLKTLETLGVLEFKDKLPQKDCWESAHPHYDSSRRETINYLIEYGVTSYYVFYSIKDGSSERNIIAKIPVEKPSYMHSFGLTENYIILTEFPFRVNPIDLILFNQPFIKNFYWEPESGTRFIVIDRFTGEIIKEYMAHSFFSFHHVAAFEKDDQLIVDIVCYDDAKIINLEVKKQNESKIEPQRYMRFYLSKNGELDSELIFQNYLEFPRINDCFDGKPYRYVYLTDPRRYEQKDDLRYLYKLDTETKKVLSWNQQGCYPGELIFVPHPDAKDEDEGVVITIVLDLLNSSSFLLILDAKDFKEIGRAVTPYQIPLGLHAKFFD
jgi:beta,beta-carotene 9',10'-dioxygenase